MRAAVARRGAIVPTDLPDLEPGPGDALVAVKACGICGSDLHTLRHAHSMVAMAEATGAPSAFDPDGDFVMGHEFSAEVLELGSGTDGVTVAPGDLVCSMPIALNANGFEPIGYSNRLPGGYGEQMLLSAMMCLKVPNGLDHRRAALTEPMAVGRHAVEKAALAKQDTALVLGCGPVGLAVIAELRRRNVAHIVAADFSAKRRATAVAMGATEVCDPSNESAIDAWRRVTGATLSLVIFEAVGVPGMIESAMTAAPRSTRIVVVGVCMETDHIRPMVGIVKELNVQFCLGYDPFEFADTLRAIAEGELDVSPMVTGRCGIDAVGPAFSMLGSPEDHVKILVEPDAPAAVEPLTIS